MKKDYKHLDQLIPLERLKPAFQKFCKSMHVGCIITNSEGQAVIEENWQCLCKNDDGISDHSVSHSCIEVENFFEGKLHSGDKSIIFTCKSGMSSVGAPIVIDGLQVASIFLGFFYYSSADIEIQKNLAEGKGTDHTTYPGTSANIPTFSEEMVQQTASQLELFVDLINEMGRNVLQERHAHMQLKKSEDRYRNMINSLPQVIFETDLQGMIVYANVSTSKTFGCTPQEIENSIDYSAFVTPEDRPKASDRLMRLFAGEILDPEEYTLMRKDGSVFSALVVSRPMYSDGVINGARGIIFDITHRVQAEEKLRESEQRYRALFEGAHAAILIIVNDNIVQCNDKALQLFKRSRQELVGTSTSSLSFTRQQDGHLVSFDTELCRFVAEQAGEESFEWHFCLPDGEVLETEVCLSRIELIGQSSFQAVFRDITEQNRSKRALKERESLWRAIFDRAPFGIAINRMSDGVFLDVNPAYEKSSGRQAAEVIGKSSVSLLPASEQEKSYKIAQALLKTGWINTQEAAVVKKDGTPGHAIYSAATFKSGKELCAVSMFVDITERKEMERKLQQSEAKMQSLFQAVPVGLTIIEGRTFRSVNERLCEITGYEASDLLNQTSRRLYESEAEFDRVGTALYGKLAVTGRNYVETLFRHKDGSLRNVSLFSAPLNSDDIGVGVAVAIQDITSQKKAEAALLRSQNRLSFAISATSDAIWEWYPEDDSTYFSPRWYEMLGYADQEFPMNIEAWKRLCYPDEFHHSGNIFRYVLTTSSDSAFNNELRMRHRNGEWVWILNRGKVMQRDAAGRPLLLAGTITDISQRKTAEIALIENEKRYRTLFEAASDAILIIQNGLITDCNAKTLEMFRCTQQEIIGRSPADLSALQQPDGNTFTERGEYYLAEALKGVSRQFEWLQSRPDGTLFYADVSLNTIELSGEKFIQAIIRDITDRKNTERALRESEFRFRSFYNSNPEGIVLLDFKGRIIDVNKAFLKKSGFVLTECVRKDFKKFVPEKYQSMLVQTIMALRSGISQKDPLQIYYHTKNGDNVPVSIRGWLVVDEESIPLYLGVFIHDLSREVVLAEEKATLEKQVIQSQKSEAIGTLAGGIAHDFNNILGGIIGYTELALHKDPSAVEAGMRNYLERVLEGGYRAKELVQQILRFSRSSNSVMEPMQLIPVIKEAAALLRSTLPTTIQIKEQVDIDSDRIIGDSTQIHQVVMNLATNAYHAMRENGGVMTITLEKVMLTDSKQYMSMIIPPGKYLQLRISDTGSGITPSVLERIFEPYFTTKKVNEGTGLGMAVVKGIIKSHRGLIEIDTTLGKGTHFDIFLPLTEAAVAQGNSSPENYLPVGNGERVLIVDDEAYFLEVVVDSLKLLGYQVTASQSSVDTLKIFRENPDNYDLVITDQTMPDMTGVQLIQEIRTINQSIPIILCTGYSETVTEQSASYYGITGFLMKPINVHDLAKAIDTILSNKNT
ncbi:PAS domain S-box protein [Desulfosediminicola flagellatus]|uniref:PAS domain S-box protein n=1 Tax=Desulfosediminicola flagellatus TaxID=2569541 RepID=UPI0010AD83A4|nr:PAS domain S-box protein [Desulfosediminicola flagellatus]